MIITQLAAVIVLIAAISLTYRTPDLSGRWMALMERPGDTYQVEFRISSSASEVIGIANFFSVPAKGSPVWFAVAKIIDGKVNGKRVTLRTVITDRASGNFYLARAFADMQFQGVAGRDEIHLTGISHSFVSKGVARRVRD